MRGPFEHPGGDRSIYFEDPAGNMVEAWDFLHRQDSNGDQEQRGNAERRAIFVGLWPPMLYLLGDSVADYDRSRRRLRRP